MLMSPVCRGRQAEVEMKGEGVACLPPQPVYPHRAVVVCPRVLFSVHLESTQVDRQHQQVRVVPFAPCIEIDLP